MIGSCVLGLVLAVGLVQEEAPAPAAAPAPATVQEAPAPADAAPSAPKSSRIVVAELTRLADPVAYLDAEAQAEQMLFFWDKNHSVRIGDGLRNGVSGSSLLRFPSDGSELYCFGATWLIVEAAGPQRRILEFKDLTRVKLDVRGSEIQIRLPGDVVLVAQDTVFYLYQDDFRTRYRIVNSGPGEVSFSGPVVPTDTASVAAGERLLLPIKIPDPRADDGELISTETVRVWRGYEVRLDAGVEFRTTPGHLILEGQGTARVGGARLRVNEGQRAQIWTPQR